MADPSLHSQASEEATKAAEDIARLLLKLNWINPYRGAGLRGEARSAGALYDDLIHDLLTADIFAPGGIQPILDRVSRERTRQALRDAMFTAEETVGLDYSDRERNIVGRAVEAIRRLRGLSDGESVASEEKEE